MAVWYVFEECKLGWHDKCHEEIPGQANKFFDLSICSCPCHNHGGVRKGDDDPMV